MPCQNMEENCVRSFALVSLHSFDENIKIIQVYNDSFFIILKQIDKSNYAT